MIQAVGIGMIEIARLQRVLDTRPSFLSRWFSDEEMEKAGRRARAAEDLSGRYACKLAVRSCLRTRLDSQTRLIDIATANDSLGKPTVMLSAPLADRAAKGFGGIFSIEVSITHSRESAAAIAILTLREGPDQPDRNTGGANDSR
ncbi:MAG TPA: hypothetical protein VFJ58_04980 [Armatimonadota bacterium]|nr:hypothetical protein [Armatimonadota bacterium]